MPALPDIIKQKPYEHIKYLLHRHPLTFIPTVILFTVLAAVPVIVYFMINTLFPAFLQSEPAYPLMVLLGSVYYLSLYLFFYAQFVDYYLDIWVVTNDRTIDIEQHGLFHRTITELDLFRIQDVTTQVNGLFKTIFNYGDVVVKTASSTSNIVFYNVPAPNQIREDLIRLADEDRKFHQGPT